MDEAGERGHSLRDAAAKYEDLSHQVEQKAAEHRNNAAKRNSDLEQAKADPSKAQIEMRKGPILSDIDRQKNQIKVQDGQDHVASLQKSIRFHEEAEAAESRIFGSLNFAITQPLLQNRTNLQFLTPLRIARAQTPDPSIRIFCRRP